MPIISVEIMKKIGEEDTQKTKQNKTQKKKKKKREQGGCKLQRKV